MTTTPSSTVSEWNLIFALPNLQPPERSIEVESIVIPSVDDHRIAGLIEREPRVSKFLNSFVDGHNRHHGCAALLCDRDKPELEGLYAFRDAVALAAVIDSICTILIYGGTPRTLYTDYFRFHPTVLSRDAKHVITHSQALMSLDESDGFVGRVNPIVPVIQMREYGFDGELLAKLMRIWRQRYVGRKQSGTTGRALFRSLSMAFEAASHASNTLTLTRDLGVRLSLWVSAFEILVWPEKGRASRTNVEDVLMRHDWPDRKVRARRYSIPAGNGTKRRVALPVYLLHLLYEARNTYLHGNPMKRSHMFPFLSRQSLLAVAPLLYRVLLEVMLPPLVKPNQHEARDYLRLEHAREWAVLRKYRSLEVERAMYAASRQLAPNDDE